MRWISLSACCISSIDSSYSLAPSLMTPQSLRIRECRKYWLIAVSSFLRTALRYFDDLRVALSSVGDLRSRAGTPSGQGRNRTARWRNRVIGLRALPEPSPSQGRFFSAADPTGAVEIPSDRRGAVPPKRRPSPLSECAGEYALRSAPAGRAPALSPSSTPDRDPIAEGPAMLDSLDLAHRRALARLDPDRARARPDRGDGRACGGDRGPAPAHRAEPRPAPGRRSRPPRGRLNGRLAPPPWTGPPVIGKRLGSARPGDEAMPIKLTNTLTGRKETFEPIDPGNVRFYVCGPTVYDFAHIGQRPGGGWLFDVLYRLLRHTYGADHVTYVRNITDVDDKIIAAHRKTGEPIEAITARFTDAYHADMDALGCLRPDVEPRATAHIAQMVALVRAAAGHRPCLRGAGPRAVPRAGRSELRRAVAPLARRHDRRRAGGGCALQARSGGFRAVEAGKGRRARLGQPLGSRPSGLAPGMLGHVGAAPGPGVRHPRRRPGPDLPAPRERASAVHLRLRRPHMANYWVHNGYLMAEGEKMSKSLGNFYTVHDLKREFPGEALRPDPAVGALPPAARLHQGRGAAGEGGARPALYRAARRRCGGARRNAPPLDVEAALDDDLNTPLAVSHLHELAGRLNKGGRAGGEAGLRGGAVGRRAALGLLGEEDPEDWLKGGRSSGGGRFSTRPPSRRRSPPGPPPARTATSPRPTASATIWPPRASSWRTAPPAPPGGGKGLGRPSRHRPLRLRGHDR